MNTQLVYCWEDGFWCYDFDLPHIDAHDGERVEFRLFEIGDWRTNDIFWRSIIPLMIRTYFEGE